MSGQDCIPSAKAIANIDSSIQFMERCISGKISDTAAYVKNVCYLSTLYNKKSLYVRSEKKLDAALQILKPNGAQRVLLGMIYNHFANIYKLKKDIAPALQLYFKAVDVFESEKNLPGLIKVHTDMAEYYRSIANYDEARRSIKKALDIYKDRKETDIPALIKIYNRSAAIENENSNSDSTLIHSLICLKLARQIKDKYAEAVSLNEIGYYYKNRHRVDTSMRCYKRAVDLWTEIGADADAAHGIYNMALLMAHHDFPRKQVIPYYENIIRLVKTKKIDYPLDQVYSELSNCYFFLGDTLKCYKIRENYYLELIQKKQKLFDTEVSNIKEKYENEKYKAQISSVSDELKVSEKNLEQKQRENLVIYISLCVLAILFIVIGFLARKVNGSNKILQVKNKEKDSLIQEIHHRVKNNLQFVSSLINMQINSSRNSAEVDSLSDASRRIRSMALVHEMLYNQNDLAGIEIKKYLSELLGSINEIVNSKNIPIGFNIECEEQMFETPKAIALGMITSELVSNSIKYAFSDTEDPRIEVRLQKTSEGISFTVRDNGKGLTSPSSAQPEKLGMRLINIFSRQVKGEYEFKNENGLVYTLVFNN